MESYNYNPYLYNGNYTMLCTCFLLNKHEKHEMHVAVCLLTYNSKTGCWVGLFFNYILPSRVKVS